MIKRFSFYIQIIFFGFFALFLFSNIGFAQNEFRRKLSLEFEPVEDSSGYEVEVKKSGPDKEKPYLFKIKNAKWSAELKPGKYLLRLRSFDDRGVPGEWSEASELVVKWPSLNLMSPKVNEILQTDSEKKSVDFLWQPQDADAELIINVIDKNQNQKVFQDNSSNGSLTASLPAGQIYKFMLKATRKDGVSTDDLEGEFSIKGGALEPPEPGGIKQNQKSIFWTVSKKAESLWVQVTRLEDQKKLTKGFRQIKNLRLPTVKLKDGVYLAEAKVEAKLFEPSQIAKSYFKIEKGVVIAIADSIEGLKSSDWASSPLKISANLFGAKMKYQGSNAVFSSTTDFAGTSGFGFEINAEKLALWKGLSLFSNFDFTSVSASAGQGDISVQFMSLGLTGAWAFTPSYLPNMYLGLGLGPRYYEVPEFLSSTSTQTVAAQFFRALNLGIKLFLGGRLSENWMLHAEVDFTSADNAIQTPDNARVTDESGVHKLALDLTYKPKQSWWWTLNLRNRGHEFQYDTDQKGRSYFESNINQLGLGVGYSY